MGGATRPTLVRCQRDATDEVRLRGAHARMGESVTGHETHEKRRVKAPQTTSIPDAQPTNRGRPCCHSPRCTPTHTEKGRGCKGRWTSAHKHASPRGLTRLSARLGAAFKPQRTETPQSRHRIGVSTAIQSTCHYLRRLGHGKRPPAGGQEACRQQLSTPLPIAPKNFPGWFMSSLVRRLGRTSLACVLAARRFRATCP